MKKPKGYRAFDALARELARQELNPERWDGQE
jgi:hypothetical protein